MSIFKKFRVKSTVPDNKGKLHLDDNKIQKKLDRNIQIIKEIFNEDGTLIKRNIQNQNNSKVKCCVFFIDGMVDNIRIDEYVIKPIITADSSAFGRNIVSDIRTKVVVSNDVKESESIDEIVKSVLYGDTIVFVDGFTSALIISTKGWETRSIAEPDTEKALRGPREGFTETILTNLSMLRRKILTPDLKFKFRTIGTRSNTKACVCYLESLADESVLTELNKRLDKIEMDGILDVNYFVELIKDAPWSPLKTIGISERPDVIASKLLEGRIAVFLDGTPVVVTVPFLFIENFQANDDYYLNFFYSSIGRLLRVLCFLLSISIPAVYVAFTAFHREMIPTDLALSIVEAHKGIPFPTVVECVIMLIIFEIIREAGIRMPSSIGQALSIVGALVIGQAAVEAKFISAPMVIIVAFTAITSLINPTIKGTTIYLRFFFLFAASLLGLYGYAFAFIIFLIYIFSMQSFGVIYTSHLTSGKFERTKDTAIRAPWKYLTNRPIFEKKDPIRKKRPD